jgi:hypothetical protein
LNQCDEQRLRLFQIGLLSGKWHLGDKPESYPIEHGFDEMKNFVQMLTDIGIGPAGDVWVADNWQMWGGRKRADTAPTGVGPPPTYPSGGEI